MPQPLPGQPWPWLCTPRPLGWRGLGGQDPGPTVLLCPPCPLAAVALVSHLPPRFQGYEGLVEGGENIKPANWLSVSNIIQLVRPVPAALPAVSARTGTCTQAHT